MPGSAGNRLPAGALNDLFSGVQRIADRGIVLDSSGPLGLEKDLSIWLHSAGHKICGQVIACMLVMSRFEPCVFGSWVDKLVFGPGNEVRAVDGGATSAGIFHVEGQEIVLTFGTDQNKLTVTDNGCLDGGRAAGTYCPR